MNACFTIQATDIKFFATLCFFFRVLFMKRQTLIVVFWLKTMILQSWKQKELIYRWVVDQEIENYMMIHAGRPAGRSTDRPDRPTDLTAHPDHSDRPDQPTDLTAHLDRLTNLTNLSNYLTDRLDQPNQPDGLTNLTNLSNYFLFDIRLHGDTQIY